MLISLVFAKVENECESEGNFYLKAGLGVAGLGVAWRG